MSKVVTKHDLPGSWMWSTLDDVSNVGAGNPAPQGDNKFENGDMPFVRVRDMGKLAGQVRLHDVGDYVNEIGAEGLKLFRKGCVLFTKSGASTLLNQRAILGQDSYVVSHIAIAEPEEGVLSEWIYYWMKLIDFGKLAHGANMPSLPLSKAKAIPVPLAPPEQQKRIVAKIEELFSHIDAGIGALEKAKQLLKQYRQSVLKAAATGELTKEWREANKAKLEPASQLLERILNERRQKWEEQQLKQFKAKGKMPKNDKWKEKYKEPDVYNDESIIELPEEWTWVYMDQLGEVIGGLTKNKKREQFNMQLPYLRVANVYANELRLDDVTKIGVQENELGRVLLEKGDLLIVEGNGSPEQIGRLAIWDGSIDPCVHQNHLIKVRLQEKDCGNYLMYWLSSLGGREAILQVASSTSGLYTLSITKVSGLLIPLPPLEEQVEIYNLVSSKLSSIEHLEQEIGLQLIKIEKNKQSVLASAFSGELGREDI